jgi:drug/metabolite transporter (DMT)-like permease
LLIGIFFFRYPFHKKKITGVVLGFAGAATLILLGGDAGVGKNPIFGLFIVVATMCYASSVNLVQGYFGHVRPLLISSVSFFLLGLPAIGYLLVSDFPHILLTHEAAPRAIFTVSLLSLFGTVMASILFYHLVQRTSAVFSSTVTYLMPLGALFLGFLDGESIEVIHFAGIAIILIGVYFTKSS